jgi:hypothetical protein
LPVPKNCPDPSKNPSMTAEPVPTRLAAPWGFSTVPEPRNLPVAREHERPAESTRKESPVASPLPATDPRPTNDTPSPANSVRDSSGMTKVPVETEMFEAPVVRMVPLPEKVRGAGPVELKVACGEMQVPVPSKEPAVALTDPSARSKVASLAWKVPVHRNRPKERWGLGREGVGV